MSVPANLTTASAAGEYDRFCVAVFDLTGLDLVQYKRQQTQRRVESFAQRAGCDTIAEYQALLEADNQARAEFLDQLTINVSQLWRNPLQWPVLATQVLPDLGQTGRVRALCAGVSYGAEAYTLAALCADVLGPDVAVDILGTDIDARMIERAKNGTFSDAEARDAPQAQLARHFERLADGHWRANAQLRELVRFEVSDLLRSALEPDSLDLVLCRNTVIYFEAPVRDALHQRFATALRGGGRLVVGASERVTHPADYDLIPELPFIYRKA